PAVGGRLLSAGDTLDLAWEAGGDRPVTTQRLDLSLDDGDTFPVPVATLDGSASSYVWSIPALDTSRARLRLTVGDGVTPPVARVSERFSVSSTPNRAPLLSLAFPTGGESLRPGASAPVA